MNAVVPFAPVMIVEVIKLLIDAKADLDAWDEKGQLRYEMHYKAGNFVFMPKGTFHENVVLSKEELIIVAIFNPAEF